MAMMGEPRIVHESGGRLMTKQAEKDAVDINKIVARARASGMPIPVGPRVAHYGDFGDARSLQESLDLVLEAESQFMELPASVRTACENSPVRFLELVHQDEGLKELIAAGLKAELIPVGVAVPQPPVPVPAEVPPGAGGSPLPA